MPRPGPKGPLPFPLRVELARRLSGTPRYVRITGALVVLALIGAVIVGVMHGRRVAAWAPISVVDSRDPLQELPIRVAKRGRALPPARTYDAVLDLSSIRSLVVGVDLHGLASGGRYQAVILASDDTERFRDTIPPAYLKGGRFMLRLFARKFRAGDYRLEIEAVDASGGRVVAASWFQVQNK